MNSLYISKLLGSVSVFGFLIYVLLHNKEPLWLMFIVSFLILTLINILENVFLLLKKRKIANTLNIMFNLTFAIFAIGFLAIWCIIAISQKQYSMLIFAIPFFIIATLIIKSKVFKNNKPLFTFDFNVQFIISAFLVGICFISGVLITILSLNPFNIMLLLFGLFFILGSLVFVFAYMQIKGYFDHLPFGFLGLFMGVVIALVGVGSLFIMYNQNPNIIVYAKFWILVPLLMIIVGVIQIVKTIRGK